MVPIAYFGINDSSVNLVISLLILFAFVIWFALIYWTVTDARRRIVDPVLIYCAGAAAFFPYVGTMIYMIVRPSEYLDDVRERELEMQASEARLAQLSYQLCPHCDYGIDKDFLSCPSCLNKLREPCSSCSKPIEPAWSLCPYCETPVPGAVPPRRRRARESIAD